MSCILLFVVVHQAAGYFPANEIELRAAVVAMTDTT